MRASRLHRKIWGDKADIEGVAGASDVRNAKDWINEGRDPGNARFWPLPRRIYTTCVVGGLAFGITFAGSIYAPAHDTVSADFGTSTTVSLLPLALYNLGLAFGPIVGAPLSETFGRKVVYQTTTPVSALFIVGAALSKNITSLTICRFFAGVFGSPGISLAAATIGDMVAISERAPYLAFYYSMPWLGSVLAPLTGSFVVDGKGWRWTQWTALLFMAVSYLSVYATKESYKRAVLKHRAKELKIEGPAGESRTFRQEVQHFMTATVIRPVHMLFTEPVVGLLCLYAAFDFGLLYVFVVASPWSYSQVYGFGLTSQGLSFVGLIVGALAAPMPVIVSDHFLYQPRLRTLKRESNTTSLPPEQRLYPAILGSILLPLGLLWWGWTMRFDIHWACPMVAQGVAIAGGMQVYIVANLYLMDTYGPLYGASSQGSNSLSRYTLSAATPLFALQMFRGLGVAWAATLLGLCSLALAPIPFVLFRWGDRIRARSKYPASD